MRSLSARLRHSPPVPRARALLALAATIGCCVLLGSGPSSHAAASSGPRYGLFSMETDAAVEGAAAGLREGFRLSGLAPQVLERSVTSDETTARAALHEFALEGVDVVFVLGPDAAQLARDTLRAPSVVFAAVGYPETLGLPGRGNICGVAGGVAAAQIVAWAPRITPALRTLGIVTAPDRESRTLCDAVEKAAIRAGMRVARASPDNATTQATTQTATETTTRADVETLDRVAALSASCEAIWLPPAISAAQAETIARALEGKGVALLGSRRGHLDAGASAILRTSPRTQGLLAAALARRILRGAAPEEVGIVRPRRVRHEISLNAAQRLGHEIPLAVIATADHLVPAIGRRR